MKAIIPTGGRGTRMRPLTFSSNKHFIPVANKPLIFYPIETVVAAGIIDIAITYNIGGLEEAQQILGDGSKWGAKFSYILQDKPAGLADVVRVCEEFIGQDKFVYHLGDNIFADGINELVEKFDKSGANGLVTMVQHEDNRRLGVPYFDQAGNFIKYVEKPENPPNNFGVPGVYFFDHHAFEAFKGDKAIEPSARGEYEVGDIYNWLMANGYKVEAMEYTGKWLDPGKFDDWISANQYLLDSRLVSGLESDLDETSTIENRVNIGQGCEIVNSAIRGPVIIGDNVKITDSYIGPYTSVSDDCEIVESHVENSVLMKGVRILEVDRSVDRSLIGTETEIVGNKGPTSELKLFVGEKSRIEI